MAYVRYIGLLPSIYGCILKIEDYPIDPDPSRFLTGDIDMVMAFFWRVRAFEVTVNNYPSGPNQPQASDTFTMKVGDIEGTTDGLSTEKDLIDSTNDWWLRDNYGNTEIDITLGSVWKDNDNYLIDFNVGDGLESFWSIYRPNQDYGTNGTWTLNFSGHKITKPLYKTFQNSGPASVTMNGIEYWEYDPNDGKGPIYNKFTGERIRFDV